MIIMITGSFANCRIGVYFPKGAPLFFNKKYPAFNGVFWVKWITIKLQTRLNYKCGSGVYRTPFYNRTYHFIIKQCIFCAAVVNYTYTVKWRQRSPNEHEGLEEILFLSNSVILPFLHFSINGLRCLVFGFITESSLRNYLG